MTDKVNLYINSSYRKADETTSFIKCIVPSGLIKSYGKDFLTLSITSFYVPYQNSRIIFSIYINIKMG